MNYTYCMELWSLMLRGMNPRGDRQRVEPQKLNYTASALVAEIQDKDGQRYRVTIKPIGGGDGNGNN